MDLRPIEDLPSEEERHAIDTVLRPATSAWEGGSPEGPEMWAAPGPEGRRDLLLPALRAVQARAGWISRGALGEICRRLGIPPAEAFGVGTFYALLSFEPRPPVMVHVCDDIACRMAGADDLCAEFEARTVAEGGDGTNTGLAWKRSPCLGRCEEAPAILLQRAGDAAGDVSLAPASHRDVEAETSGDGRGPGDESPLPQAGEPALRLLRRIGRVDPASLDDYRAHGGYEALRTAVALGPEGVIREVKDSNLLGRGGAAFPTGVKWEAVARQPVRPHYFVCNADESEPGTFKDRILMERDPFALLESLTIAAYATGSEQGFVYVRGEYPLAAERLGAAIELARTRGYLGEDVCGEGFRFDVELRQGAGAYIAGEETALFNSIEGRRAEPRNKPPFPVTHGLFGKPTGINNVETLVNVLEILRIGGQAFARVGTEGSTGTRLFCLSGCVERPGLYEVEFGATLREVLDLAGGIPGGRPLRAVLLGGAAGSFVGPEDLDLPLTFEATQAAGVSLGSGVLMPFDDTVDLEWILLRIARFFRDESCGQCVPCRVGTVRQEELLYRLKAGRAIGSQEQELAMLNEIAAAMRDASICGLGQTASGAILSGISRLGLFPAGAAT
jgi:NADH-quinone oxidoreductase subunit F